MKSILKLSAVVALGVMLSGQSARACHGLFRCGRCARACYAYAGYGYAYLPAVGYASTTTVRTVHDDTKKPEHHHRAETHPEPGEKKTQLELIIARQDRVDADLKRLDKNVDDLKKLIEERLPAKKN
ncbi:MAG TPA: hypothetical protein VGH33_26245 [Isosphaeraceae bacterium]|jgi:ferredoxin